MTKAFTHNDKYFNKAKEQWYRARSAFKLLEIQEKFRILKKWQSVLDLWAFPWSWLQVCKQIIWNTWTLVWLDIQEIQPLSWVHTLVCDIFSEELKATVNSLHKWKFDVILSDMAPNTSWIPDVDQYKSVEINLAALDLMKSYLKKWWWWVFKLFKWADFNDFWFEAKKVFTDIKTFKPNSSRDRSVEIFCVWKKSI